MQWLYKCSQRAKFSPGEYKEHGTKRCLVVASRPKPLLPEEVPAIRERLEVGHYFVVAADGGALVAEQLGLVPDVVIGDMDSLGETEQLFAEMGCRFVRFKAEKDETDTHLALQWAYEQGYRDLSVLLQRSGRLDHVLSAIWVGTGFLSKSAFVRYVDSGFEAVLLKGPAELVVRSAKPLTVSLLPIASQVHGVTIEGMKYPLMQATLSLGESRGISNETVSETAHVRVREGILLVTATDTDVRGTKPQSASSSFSYFT